VDVNKHAARPFGEAGAVSSPPLCFSFDLQNHGTGQRCHGFVTEPVTTL
jgi:hypothetical protein